VEAPFAFLTPDGRVTGEHPELARVITQRLGFRAVEWRLTEFGSLITGLEAKRFDVIAAGLFVTPDRARRIAFSHPTFRVRSGLLVVKGNPRSLRSYRSMVSGDPVRIAVLSHSVEETELAGMGMPPDRLVRVPDASSGRALVVAGKVDGLALSLPTVRWMAQDDPSSGTEFVEMIGESAPGEVISKAGLGAFGFRRSDRALLDAWNRELARYVGCDEHRQLGATFGFEPSDLPVVTDAQPGMGWR